MTEHAHSRPSNVLLSLALTLSGCCYSSQQSERAQERLRAINLESTEPIMATAAAEAGAALMPVVARQIFPLRPCLAVGNAGSLRGCVQWESSDHRAFRFLDEEGASVLGVWVSSMAWPFARLARRGTTLIVLDAQVTHRVIRRCTKCECAIPSPGFYDVSRDLRPAFLIRNAPTESVEVLKVPIIVESIRWDCRAFLGGA